MFLPQLSGRPSLHTAKRAQAGVIRMIENVLMVIASIFLFCVFDWLMGPLVAIPAALILAVSMTLLDCLFGFKPDTAPKQARSTFIA